MGLAPFTFPSLLCHSLSLSLISLEVRSRTMLSAGLLLGKTASLRWLALTTAKPLSNRLAFSTMAVTKQVGTHNGSFHCDEALACFLLRLTNKFSGANVVRTRDLQVPTLKLFSLHSIFRLVPAKIPEKPYCFP